MLGHHDESGRALAVYAAVTDVARNRLLSAAGRSDRLLKKQWPQIRKRLEQHFEMAEYLSHTLLSYGQSHEFGDYRALAKEIYETFAAASEAIEDFFEKAHFAQRAFAYGLRSSPGESSEEASEGALRRVPSLVSRWLGSRRER